ARQSVGDAAHAPVSANRPLPTSRIRPAPRRLLRARTDADASRTRPAARRSRRRRWTSLSDPSTCLFLVTAGGLGAVGTSVHVCPPPTGAGPRGPGHQLAGGAPSPAGAGARLDLGGHRLDAGACPRVNEPGTPEGGPAAAPTEHRTRKRRPGVQ